MCTTSAMSTRLCPLSCFVHVFCVLSLVLFVALSINIIILQPKLGLNFFLGNSTSSNIDSVLKPSAPECTSLLIRCLRMLKERKKCYVKMQRNTPIKFHPGSILIISRTICLISNNSGKSDQPKLYKVQISVVSSKPTYPRLKTLFRYFQY